MDRSSADTSGGVRAEPEERITLAIGGMTCAACSRRVEKALRKAPGVRDAVVNLATHRAAVVFEPAVVSPAALAAVVADAGYRASPETEHVADDDSARLGRRALAALIAGLPVVVLGMSHHALTIPGSVWIQLALSLVVLIYAGGPIYRAALATVRHRSADMNVLVALGTSAAFAYSAVATVWPAAHPGVPVYYEAAVAVIGFVVLGRWLEARARRRAGEALGRLRRLVPPTATMLVDGREERVAVERLVPGDLVVVRPGQILPVDGEIVEGESTVAQAVLTGESMPIDKRPGDLVLAGTSNGWGRVVVRATRPADETALADIVAIVEQALGSRAPIARAADRVAAVFTPVVLAVAIVTFVAWLAFGPSGDRLTVAILDAVAVLVVACPCALGLATPTALVVGLGRGAQLGVLFKSAAALERLGGIEIAVVDKTGTLTEGQPQLAGAAITPGWDERRLLALVAGAEEGSEHPLAGAFLRAAGKRGVAVAPARSFAATPGRGITAQVDGHEVIVGSPRFTAERGAVAREDMVAEMAVRGLTPVVAVIDGAVAAVYGVGDVPRAGAAAAIRELAAQGIEVVMLTGDDRRVAEAVAAELGIRRVIAGAAPADKARHVAELRSGRRVAMVGDGVNDAPALAAADVGIAMGSATDVVAASAEIVLLRDELSALAASIRLARRTLRIIRQNLFWAFVYNAAALPIAAGVLQPFTGWQLSPMIASAAMSLSSLSVVLNSLRLRRG